MKLSISTTRREMLLGWSYLLINILVLPSLIGTVGYRLELSLTEHNIFYFCINFLAILAIFHRFLWESVKAAWAKPWRCLRYAFQGLCIYYVLMLLVSAIIKPWIDPNFSNVNNDAIMELAQEHTMLFTFCTVLLVPVTEEVLYRGLLFQGLYEKNRWLAYCVSVLFFAAIHLLDFIGSTDWKTLLVCFLQYLPAGIALAGAYEVSDTIVTPILMHITINQISIAAMR